MNKIILPALLFSGIVLVNSLAKADSDEYNTIFKVVATERATHDVSLMTVADSPVWVKLPTEIPYECRTTPVSDAGQTAKHMFIICNIINERHAFQVEVSCLSDKEDSHTNKFLLVSDNRKVQVEVTASCSTK